MLYTKKALQMGAIAVGLAAFAGQSSLAESAKKEDSKPSVRTETMQVMPELTMASHFVGVPYNRSGVSVSIINPEEFQKAGIETLTGALSQTPGVFTLDGGGTWQRFIDLDETWLVPVPPAVDDLLAARGYINPLTAMLMLKRWPVAGKHLVLTAASSSCASLLGQWALAMGARSVSGIIRSPQHRARLEQAGIYPILDTDRALMEKVSQHSDLVFDAVGGELANTLLSVLPASSTLISYGLLSGRPLTQTRGSATVRKFHLREALPTLSVAAWRAAFDEIWQRLPTTSQPPAQRIALNDWRAAIAAAGQPGRGGKILLDFTAG